LRGAAAVRANVKLRRRRDALSRGRDDAINACECCALTWKLYSTATFTSTSALSFHKVTGVRVSRPMLVATVCKHNRQATNQLIDSILLIKHLVYKYLPPGLVQNFYESSGEHHSKNNFNENISVFFTKLNKIND
jgi:hypothetical protein